MSVSIVMPNLNNAKYIRQCLESVAGDERASEIVIYDDGSTDGSVEVIEGLGLSKVRVLRREKSGIGAMHGRHRAVEAASNDLIYSLDGDDFLEEGAISGAYDRLVEDRLDLSLLQMINVDRDGANPKPFLIPPDDVIDGRTAFEMTLGGWRMHMWGVLRKDVYFEAYRGARLHGGYSNDEVLTREILLRCGRIAGTQGKMFYRVNPKARTPTFVVGQMRTAIYVLQLAVKEGVGAEPIRQQRNMVVRFMLGTVRRAAAGKIAKAELASLMSEYRSINVGWSPADFPFHLMDRVIRSWPVGG